MLCDQIIVVSIQVECYPKADRMLRWCRWAWEHGIEKGYVI